MPCRRSRPKGNSGRGSRPSDPILPEAKHHDLKPIIPNDAPGGPLNFPGAGPAGRRGRRQAAASSGVRRWHWQCRAALAQRQWQANERSAGEPWAGRLPEGEAGGRIRVMRRRRPLAGPRLGGWSTEVDRLGTLPGSLSASATWCVERRQAPCKCQ